MIENVYEEKNWVEDPPTYEDYLRFQWDVLNSQEEELNDWIRKQVCA